MQLRRLVNRPNVLLYVLRTNAYLFKRFVIFCCWRDTKSIVFVVLEHSVCSQCPSRATETMDLVSLRHTLGSLFSLDVAALISACEKPVSDDTHTCEASIQDSLLFFMEVISAVCVGSLCLSLTHASDNSVVLEYTDISIFLIAIIEML